MQSIRIIVAKNGFLLTKPESYGVEYVAKSLEEVKTLLKKLLDPIESETPTENKRSRKIKK